MCTLLIIGVLRSRSAGDTGELRWALSVTNDQRQLTLSDQQVDGAFFGVGGELSWGLSFPLSLFGAVHQAWSAWVRSPVAPPLSYQWRGELFTSSFGLRYQPSDQLSPRISSAFLIERQWISDAFVWVPYGRDGARGDSLVQEARLRVGVEAAAAISLLFDDYRGAAIELYGQALMRSSTEQGLFSWGLRLSLSDGQYL